MPPTPIPSPSWLTLIILSIFSRLKKSLLRTPHKSSNVSMPSYSVLIPAYNEGELIPEALRSCANQTIKPERVIILDDLSTATDYHAIISEVYPSAEIIRAEKRQGKAYNITKYVNVVSSDYVLVLDADSYISPDYVEKLLKKHPFDVAFGTIMPDEISGGAVYGRQRLIEYILGQSIWKRAFNLIGSSNITGCFAIYRTSLLKTIGFPSTTVTEDLDLSWTVLEQDGKIVYAPEALGYTREPRTFKEYSTQVKRWYKGFWQCVKTHGASNVGKNNSLTLSLNFVFLDQLLLAPIWLAFLIGSFLLGLSSIPVLAPSFRQLLSIGFFSWFTAAWYRWFPFAVSYILALASITFDVCVITFLTLSSARANRKTKLAMSALPFYFFLSWYNRFVFWMSGLKTAVTRMPTKKETIW
jgi:cellulose synthase/poly-beta-1,6-N-acetylglucosamine synthase-like glycosyltransferase